MPGYNLNGLGSQEFERLAQALIKEIIGPGATVFGAGRDGAREATYSGTASYPSNAEQWHGDWIFQAKYHDTNLLGVDKARKTLVTELAEELEAVTKKYKHPCDNYIAITNVPLTSVPETGTRAQIEKRVFSKYRESIRNFALWGADDINRLLDRFPDIRSSYLHFIVPGDLIAKLLRSEAERDDEVERTIQAYIQTSYARDQNAQLDQAGDVTDESVRLQQVFFDLEASVHPDSPPLRWLNGVPPRPTAGPTKERSFLVARLLLAEAADRVVLIGGPGEGKSTIGQYLTQLHRATLLQKQDDIALSNAYLTRRPRLPFRIILKDYGQWLAANLQQDPAGGAVDQYICDQIKILTSREIEPQALHRIITSNPVLLVLDGLDEVTDSRLKKTLMSRIGEFADRCESVFKTDLQILATSRPTGYNERFDPEIFVHLRLVKLEPNQVILYVKKWTRAKEFDEQKASRVLASMEECIADPQIKLMATTPLQVTILAVIVALGGTPPRQREALFNEYLEVIYKRETAKGRNIIQSEKEQLIGLHKFVGYVLHEKATTADATGALLAQSEYDALVAKFLVHQNPYQPRDLRMATHKAITKDAGDRLVLIVEPRPAHFGFELRSIQEFFAACHLLDTSLSTVQRFLRFEAISRLVHWRNVALFFAGRVGRNFSGEVANIVEVCRAIDREGPDRHLRWGSKLALELAADRAFGPNARGQRSLLEHGLLILESDLSEQRLGEVCDVLERLPSEDVRDHVQVLLSEKIDILDPSRLDNLTHAAQTVGATDLTQRALGRMSSDPKTRGSCVRALALHGPGLAPPGVCIENLIANIGADEAVAILQNATWTNVAQILGLVPTDVLKTSVFSRLVTGLLAGHPALLDGTRQPGLDVLLPCGWGDEPIRWAVQSASIVVRLAAVATVDAGGLRGRSSILDETESAQVPSSIIRGEIPSFPDAQDCSDMLMAPMWALHLWLGEPTVTSLSAFGVYYELASRDPRVRDFFGNQRWLRINPALDLMVADVEARRVGPADSVPLVEVLAYAGRAGTKLWIDKSIELSQRLDELRGSGRGVSRGPSIDSRLRHIVQTVYPGFLFEHGFHEANAMMPGPNLMESLATSFLDDGSVTLPRIVALHGLVYPSTRREAFEQRTNIVRGLLRSNRRDVPELLTLLLPHCLANSNTITDGEVLQGLRIIGELGDLDINYINISELPIEGPAGIQRALELTAQTQEQLLVAGRNRLVISYCRVYLTQPHSRLRWSRLKFRGLAELHRSFAQSPVAHTQLAGLHLYLARPPTGEADFNLLGEVARTAWTEKLGYLLPGMVSTSLRSQRLKTYWIAAMTQWLDQGLRPEARAAIANELDRLLSGNNQSLASLEAALGLPLQGERYTAPAI